MSHIQLVAKQRLEAVLPKARGRFSFLLEGRAQKQGLGKFRCGDHSMPVLAMFWGIYLWEEEGYIPLSASCGL